ncbi:3-deoxy-7-phosphoheptulonate synthase [Streptomyces wedmorensis]|uniref:Phospho-2-dehydro-3-deoxyheptonate aldolase n=1 Tax=Streptomyces wedmorensis TaxID=43759 RepID=A0ABW6J4Q5_STRWE
MPPPVPAAGCALPRRRTASVARGEAVLLLGGSRAGPPRALTEDGMRQRRRTLLQMERALAHATALPVVKVGWTVGTWAPPPGHDVPYATTGHLLWLGESHEPDGDHAGHLSSVHNPVAVRLGPGTCPDTVLAAVDRLDPHRAPGRLTLVAAMGADRVRDLLPAVVEKVRAEGASVCWVSDWVSDPVRANTTREEVRDEVRGFVEVHRSSGSHPGGVHVDPAAASGGGPATGGPDRGPALDVAFHFAEACGEPRRDPCQEGRRADPRDASVRPGW